MISSRSEDRGTTTAEAGTTLDPNDEPKFEIAATSASSSVGADRVAAQPATRINRPMDRSSPAFTGPRIGPVDRPERAPQACVEFSHLDPGSARSFMFGVGRRRQLGLPRIPRPNCRAMGRTSDDRHVFLATTSTHRPISRGQSTIAAEAAPGAIPSPKSVM